MKTSLFGLYEFLVRDDAGQGLVEYALIIALIAIVCVASLRLFATGNNNSLQNSVNKLPG